MRVRTRRAFSAISPATLKRLPDMLILNCSHVDTCLSDFWSGHHLPHIQIPVHDKITFRELRDAMHSELSTGCVLGSDDWTRDDSGAIGDAWFAAAHAAINRDVRPAKKGASYPFAHLEPATDEDCESVYAFFVFTVSDESRVFWLRHERDELEKAQPFVTMRAAHDAYAATARELARYGQSHAATVHVTTGADREPAEYPDTLLTLTRAGNVKSEAC